MTAATARRAQTIRDNNRRREHRLLTWANAAPGADPWQSPREAAEAIRMAIIEGDREQQLIQEALHARAARAAQQNPTT
jgi:hypothetical protein